MRTVILLGVMMGLACSAWTCNAPATVDALPAATVGAAYSAPLAAAGTWSYADGTSVPGLNVSGDLLEGNPTATGNFVFVAAEAAATSTAESTSQSFSVCVGPAPLVFPPMSLSNMVVGVGYSVQFTVTGGTPPYNFTILTGSLPAGITLSSTGLLSGTPTTANASDTFVIGVTDSSTISCPTSSSSAAAVKGPQRAQLRAQI
jgi:large repetitive protein